MLLAIAAVVTAEPPPAPDAVAVVVGRASTRTEISRDDLRDIYLRRQRLWSDGAPVIPVNLPAGNPVREEFSRIVLGRSSQDLATHWNARYFEGIRPPIVLASATAVCAYVGAEPAAIGYLPVKDLDPTCRVLLTLRQTP